MPLGSVGYEVEANAKGERLVWFERIACDTLAALRRPGESYSDVILRLSAGELDQADHQHNNNDERQPHGEGLPALG